MEYIGIIHKDPKSDFGVSFPDFPGCITAGSTLQEAMEMAKEALYFHIEGMLEDGEKIPAPSQLDEIMKDPDFQDGTAVIVSINPPDKTIRFNMTAPQSMLNVIDKGAKAAGVSRSEFLAKAGVAAAQNYEETHQDA